MHTHLPCDLFAYIYVYMRVYLCVCECLNVNAIKLRGSADISASKNNVVKMQICSWCCNWIAVVVNFVIVLIEKFSKNNCILGKGVCYRVRKGFFLYIKNNFLDMGDPYQKQRLLFIQ